MYCACSLLQFPLSHVLSAPRSFSYQSILVASGNILFPPTQMEESAELGKKYEPYFGVRDN